MKRSIVFPTRGYIALKKYFYIAMGVLCAIVLVFLAFKINFTHEAAINRNYKGSAYEYQSDAAISPIKNDEKRSIYIYNTKSGQLGAAVMDKGILGYQIRSISGFVSPDSQNKSISFTYRSFFENYTVTWGFTTQDISGVTVGKEIASLVDYNNGKLWFVCEKAAVKAGKITMSLT